MPEAKAAAQSEFLGPDLGRTVPLKWKMTAIVVWLVFSVALALWWVVFGIEQSTRLSEMAGQTSPAIAGEIARTHRMLMSEGGTLIALLLIGGVSLLYMVLAEIKRTDHIKNFFAAFTHDLKTSLASLRLQAESLEEDAVQPSQGNLLRRLVKDTVRLQLQLENALLLASPDDSSKFLFERLRLGDLFQPMRYHWPELEIEVKGDAVVTVDRRAAESIFKNLQQNAVVHGGSTRVVLEVHDKGAQVSVHVKDNGRGFKGDRSQLGARFTRLATTSGSGLGLYLASQLTSKMNGKLEFCESDSGFCVEVSLPRAEAK